MEYELRKEANENEYREVYNLKQRVWDVDTITLINLASQDRFLSKMEYHAILHSHEKFKEARQNRMIKAELDSSRNKLFND